VWAVSHWNDILIPLKAEANAFFAPSALSIARDAPRLEQYKKEKEGRLTLLSSIVVGYVLRLPGGAQVMWFSNFRAIKGDIPDELLALLPSPVTLQQGRKSVGDQFKCSYARGERDHMLYFATFNNLFAVAGVTAADRTLWLKEHSDKFAVFVPGSFRSAS
jgi:hypothetical protein